MSQLALEPPTIRRDGFGTRQIELTAQNGRVERLVLSPALSTPVSEQAIRARAAYLTGLGPAPVGRVVRIERKGTDLSILSEVPQGATLSDILAALEFGTLTISDDEVLELAASVVQAASSMHQAFGPIVHGALCSAHVVVTLDGETIFTGAVFGDALQALKRNREYLWREFGLALPSAASVPRFDRRSDVTQLGALVLAILQRRSLRRDEFPRGFDNLVMNTSMGQTTQLNSRLRAWLQDALQLHGRVVFESCVDAAAKFGRVLPNGRDEVSALALRMAIRSTQSAPELSHPSVA